MPDGVDYTSDSTNTEDDNIVYLEGYESEYINEDEDFNSDEDGDPGEQISPTGQPLNANQPDLSEDQFNQVVFGDDNHVFGLPYKYSPLADPCMRVWDVQFSENTNIVFFQFGTMRINRALYGNIKDVTEHPELLGMVGDIMTIPSISSTDTRLVSFRPNLALFYAHLTVAANYLWSMMDMSGQFNYNDSFENSYGKTGFPFYCTKATSVSEGVSNNYAAPSIVDSVNANAGKQREEYLTVGTYGDLTDDSTGGLFSKAVTFAQEIATNITERAEELVSSIPVIGTIASLFMTGNEGSVQFFADMWGASESQMDYQLNFKFSTPYGNKLDIFRQVYFPWLILFTAAHPRQDGRFAYKEPFLIRCTFPGKTC